MLAGGPWWDRVNGTEERRWYVGKPPSGCREKGSLLSCESPQAWAIPSASLPAYVAELHAQIFSRGTAKLMGITGTLRGPRLY